VLNSLFGKLNAEEGPGAVPRSVLSKALKRSHRVVLRALRAPAALLALPLLMPAPSAATDVQQILGQAMVPSLSLASGQTFWESTFFLDARQGTELSARANAMRSGGFEASTGQWVSFDRWYSTRWIDTRLTWMTQVHRDLGLIWGFSTGERGEKYRIEPSLRLGFTLQREIDRRWHWSLTAATTVGGRLREKSCVADYGEIGGVQAVNCRLAATPLAPADTLQYLVNQKPYERHVLRARLNFTF
jgi:hypothetical protein